MAIGGASAAGSDRAATLFSAFCWAWLIAGLLNVAIALLQVFTPDLPDGTWIAHSGYPGRAVGNLRQPNHLSSLLLWSCIAVIGLLELKRLRRNVAAAALALLVFAVVLTASRTGLVSVVLLALWGLADRRLSRQARGLLLAAPLVYALAWLGMAQWAALSQHSFGGSARLAETDISSSRFAIWRDTLELIRMHPWTGVGFGEFNIAWTLTPFPNRPVAFFDHTHNLPLQLAVELGLPLAALVMGLLLWALWCGARNAWSADKAGTAVGVAQRCAMLMVVMIGLHSLLEYPLWYSYFLLPAAWAWGFALQGPAGRSAVPGATDAEPATRHRPAAAQRDNAAAHAQRSAREAPSRGLMVAAAAVVVGAVLSVADYHRVALIFNPGDGLAPLDQRIATGQRSVLFAHHADYAAVTAGGPVADPAHAFDRVTHYLLDTRLMIAWAKSLAAQGRLDEARHIAARLREFGKADAEDFFSVCTSPDAAAVPDVVPPPAAARVGSVVVIAASAPHAPASAASAAAGVPFQCQLPTRTLSWQDFLPQ